MSNRRSAATLARSKWKGNGGKAGMDNGHGQGAEGPREWIPPCGYRKGMGSRNAAASLPARSGADGSRVCGCAPSLCLSEEVTEKWVVELVSSSSRADEQALLDKACE